MNKNILVLTAFLLLMVSCKSAKNYMPLADDNWWEYHTSTEEMGLQTEETYKFVEVTSVTESSRHGTLYRISKREETGHSYYYYMSYADDKLTVFEDTDSRVGEVYIQGPIQENNRWRTMNRLDTHRWSYEIVSTNATVSVPAGRFTDCLHIEYTDSYERREAFPGDEDVTNEFWYAPGVGYVKHKSTIENDDYDYTWEYLEELVEFELN